MSDSETDAFDRDRTWQSNYDPTSEYRTDMTVRDLAWSAALECMEARVMFRQWCVRERADLEQRHSRTVRRALNSMVELGWLERVEDKPSYFKPGEKAKDVLGITSPLN